MKPTSLPDLGYHGLAPSFEFERGREKLADWHRIARASRAIAHEQEVRETLRWAKAHADEVRQMVAPYDITYRRYVAKGGK